MAEIDAAPVYGPRIEPIATSYNGRPTGEPSAERWGKLPLKGGKTTGEFPHLKSARFPLPGETVEKSIFTLLSKPLSPGITSLNPSQGKDLNCFCRFPPPLLRLKIFFNSKNQSFGQQNSLS